MTSVRCEQLAGETREEWRDRLERELLELERRAEAGDDTAGRLVDFVAHRHNVLDRALELEAGERKLDRWLVEAHKAGVSNAELGRLAGMTREGIRQRLERLIAGLDGTERS